MICRLANLNDVPAIYAIETQSYPHPWSLQFFRDEMSLEHNITLCLEENEALLAFLLTSYLFRECHIHNIAVSPAFRKQGLALRLLQELPRFCPDIQLAYLEVSTNNTRAQAIYRRFGFYEVNRRNAYYKDGSDAILMTKSY